MHGRSQEGKMLVLENEDCAAEMRSGGRIWWTNFFEPYSACIRDAPPSYDPCFLLTGSEAAEACSLPGGSNLIPSDVFAGGAGGGGG